MATISLLFNHPDRAISPNGQVPLTKSGALKMNYKKVALKRATRNTAYLLALKELNGSRYFPAKTVDVIWRYKGRKPDLDNIVARLKPLIDGCCKAFGIDDRDLEFGQITRRHTLDEEAGTVQLIFFT